MVGGMCMEDPSKCIGEGFAISLVSVISHIFVLPSWTKDRPSTPKNSQKVTMCEGT